MTTSGNQTLYLIGGGPGAMLAMRRHFKAALADLPTKKPLVAYVGAASHDNVGFQKMISAGFAFLGARVRPVKLAAKSAKVSAARALLEDCDVVFMSGGDVEHGMEVLNERGMVPFFRELARAGKPMMGVSAGSLMLAREWVRFPGDADANAELFPCMDIAPLHVDAHSEEDDWKELRTVVRLLHRRGDADQVGYGLTRKGALRVRIGAKVTLEPQGTPIPRLVVKAGRVVDGKPLPLV